MKLNLRSLNTSLYDSKEEDYRTPDCNHPFPFFGVRKISTDFPQDTGLKELNLPLYWKYRALYLQAKEFIFHKPKSPFQIHILVTYHFLKCVVPENIQIHPKGGYWNSKGEGRGCQKPK